MKFTDQRLTSDIVVLTGQSSDMRLLVIKRKDPPFKNMWALPGGFAGQCEYPIECAKRELEEETSLKLNTKKIIGLTVREKKFRDPRGPVKTHPFLCWLEKEEVVFPNSDALEVKWIKLDDLEDMAFDHGSILCEALGMFWEGMPTYNKLLSGVEVWNGVSKDFFKHNNMIFFGGTFNPWHEGHTECVRQCPDKDKLVVFPDNNPFKEIVDDQYCFWNRYKSILKTVSGYNATVFPGFCGVEKKNKTSAWLPNVDAQSKSLLLGDDSFIDLEKWYDVDILLKSLKNIYVVPRELSQVNYQKVIKWIQEKEYSIQVDILCDHPYQKLSSTDLRNKEI